MKEHQPLPADGFVRELKEVLYCAGCGRKARNKGNDESGRMTYWVCQQCGHSTKAPRNQRDAG